MNWSQALTAVIENPLILADEVVELFDGIGIEPPNLGDSVIIDPADLPELAIVAGRLAALVDLTGRESTEWVAAALDLLERGRDGEPPTYETRLLARVMGLGARLAASLIRQGYLPPLRPIEPCTLTQDEIMWAIVGA